MLVLLRQQKPMFGSDVNIGSRCGRQQPEDCDTRSQRDRHATYHHAPPLASPAGSLFCTYFGITEYTNSRSWLTALCPLGPLFRTGLTARSPTAGAATAAAAARASARLPITVRSLLGSLAAPGWTHWIFTCCLSFSQRSISFMCRRLLTPASCMARTRVRSLMRAPATFGAGRRASRQVGGQTIRS